tara:strand:+ start:1 stop:870 length:870 start_codon:yes stop_codon:yes gene_type:complete
MNNISELEKKLNTLCAVEEFDTKYYFKNLESNESINLYGKKIGPSASTRKISILMSAMKAVHEKKISLYEEITPPNKYFDNDSGCFQYFQKGFKVKLIDLLTMMIIVSDNVSTGTITEILSLDYINNYCQDIGMQNTSHLIGYPDYRDPAKKQLTDDIDFVNSTTPIDVGNLLELINLGMNNSKLARRLSTSKELCKLAMKILLSQQLNEKIPLKLSSKIKIAHKTGTYLTGTSDCGIVYPSNHKGFIICLYTDKVPEYLSNGEAGFYRAKNIIGSITLECYKFVMKKA